MEFLKDIDVKLFMEQKNWLAEVVLRENEESKFAEDILNLLDKIQDYCEQKYNIEFSLSNSKDDKMCHVKTASKRIKKLKLKISKSEAERIYREVERQYHKEDITNCLEDIRIEYSDSLIDSIIDTYEEFLSNSCEWLEQANSSIDIHIENKKLK